jgi:ParB family chromosome partitioning protein
MVNDKIKMADIDASDRLRPIDPAHVELIAASIAEQGLLQPIRVRASGGGYTLVAGAHRFAALEAMGRTELVLGDEVLIAEVTKAQAKIDEIDENLARHELNPLDRAIFLAERKKLYLAGRPESARGGDRKSQKLKEKIKGQTLVFDQNFAKATSERVGLSKSAINMAIQLIEKLDSEAIASLRGTKIETNQRELQALAELDHEQQRLVADAIRSGKAKSTLKAKVLVGLAKETAFDPDAYYQGLLISSWEKASKVARRNFMEWADLIHKPALDAPDAALARTKAKGGAK